ncbi:basic secretory protein-like protein [soil metagenome]
MLIRRLPVILAAILLATGFAETAMAQYFGRNKVRYDNFDFRILETEHFDIYYYPVMEEYVRDAARMAERWYTRLSGILDHEFDERKMIIFYADDADFRQTNVVGGFIGEGTGGITEGLKQRIVMPLAASYADTDHVLGHELVHQFQYDMSTRSGTFQNFVRLPLWLVEGMAEYLSVGREDAHTAMWLREAALRDRFPTLDQLSRDPRLFPYRFGQAFWAFMGGSFGDEVVGQLFRRSMEMPFENALLISTGLTPDSLSSQWANVVREQYLPLLEGRVAPALIARAIDETQEEDPARRARRAERSPTAERIAAVDTLAASLSADQARLVLARSLDAGDMNIAPRVSPDGRYVAFLSERDIFGIDLFLADAETGRVIKKLEEVGTDHHFDALRFIDSAGTWSPDGEQFAYVVFVQGDNEIALLDVASRTLDRRIRVDGIGAIKDPAWSPDGRSIAFSGMRGGISDLYLVDVQGGVARQLTSDRHLALQPVWSPDGTRIAFVTDRGPGTSFERLTYAEPRIALYTLETGEIELLNLFATGKHINPAWSPDGQSLYFVADPDGFSNIYRLEMPTGQVSQVTNLVTGVSGITSLAPAMSVAQQTGRLMYSTFEGQNYYSVYSLTAEQAVGTPTSPADAVTMADAVRARILPALTPPDRATTVDEYLADAQTGLPATRDFATRGFNPRLRLDYISQANIGVGNDPYHSSGIGVAGGISFLFTDQLSDRMLGVTVQAQGSIKDIGAQAIYLNMERRLNWGAQAAHVPALRIGIYQDQNGFVLRQFQRIYQSQIGGLASYPLSQTRRFEADINYLRYGFEFEREVVELIGNNFQIRRVPIPEWNELYPTLHLGQLGGAFVGDYSFFGFTSPVRGGRYRFGLNATVGGSGATPARPASSLNFVSATADYRRYFFVHQLLTVATRTMHQGRYGPDAGTGNINPFFLGFDTLVRGYNYGSFEPAEFQSISGRLFGSRMAVANVELRMPFLGTTGYGLINFPFLPTELIAFGDAGIAWGSFDEFPITDSSGNIVDVFRRGTALGDQQGIFSAGVGARVNLFGALIVQTYYAVPFSRPGRSGLGDGVFGFVLSPGW